VPAVEKNLPAKLCAPLEVALGAALLPRPLVFTNGVFDVLHRGHVQSLAQARALGRSLVVGLNSDLSVRALGKGAGRPINNEIDRAWVLDALSAVTMIVLFDEAKPLALLRQVRPDIYAKGADYDMRELEEAHVVAQWGGRSHSLAFVPGYSTTAIVEHMREAALPQRCTA
jgi:rfaE bifunctional protein nucleotidyltransferase chain/domain